ncbi:MULTISPECIES: hypothetical protein [Streptomyces]|uniref:hypothetical protein n=1 Tax=Streptomyces TaxID=1883 RepID=UPI002666D495|nr:hypothetical protein [Streptomyces sp. JUS-F4]WKN15930.1 hypothetical protein NEH83_18130 [Streptomyces sp. JUS-F4]
MRGTTGFAGLVALAAAAVLIWGGAAPFGATATDTPSASSAQAAPAAGDDGKLEDNKGNG